MSTRSSRFDVLVTGVCPGVDELVATLRAVGAVDRASPRGTDPARAQEVLWGGRMQRALLVREEPAASDDGRTRLRIEADIAGDGIVEGLARHAGLVLAVVRALGERVAGVEDVSARTLREIARLERIAVGDVQPDDVTTTIEVVAGEVGWLATHGAARAAVPDLELYGLTPAQLPAGRRAIDRILAQLLADGLRAPLSLPDDTPVRLVPVLEVWGLMPMSWPGVGRAGVDRGAGLDGPRATLSVLHRARLGRHRLDLDGVRVRLRSDG